MLEQGEVEKKIMEQCFRGGYPLPEAIMNAPVMAFGMQLYFNAFLELSSCRQAGMSVGPIPWTSIADYAKAFDLDPDQTDDMFFFVRALDNEYVSRENKKASSKISGK